MLREAFRPLATQLRSQATLHKWERELLVKNLFPSERNLRYARHVRVALISS